MARSGAVDAWSLTVTPRARENLESIIQEYPHESAHSHEPGHHHAHAHSAAGRTLLFALALTLGFSLVEMFAGWRSGSLALLADAGHMVTDGAALGISALAAWLAARPPSRRHTYGLGRAELLRGGLVSESQHESSFFVGVLGVDLSFVTFIILFNIWTSLTSCSTASSFFLLRSLASLSLS